MNCDAYTRLPILDVFMSNRHHLRNPIQDTSTRPLTATCCTPLAIGIAISRFRHVVSLLLADSGIKLRPVLFSGKELILMAGLKALASGPASVVCGSFPGRMTRKIGP
jgi:hypothetical protein